MQKFFPTVCVAATVLALGASVGCNGNGPLSATPPSATYATPQNSFRGNLTRRATGKIQHVVIIMQENRSFDNLFQGFPGADTKAYGYDSSGHKVTLNPISLATRWDIDHSSTSFFAACNGTGQYPGTKCRMNGFNKEYIGCGRSGYPCPYPEPEYGYVPHSESAPYFAMGGQYVVCLLYTSPSPRDRQKSRMPSSA